MHFLPTRRHILAAAAALPITASAVLRAAEPDLSALQNMTGDAKPIDAAERARRLSRAQTLMRAHGLSAVLVEPGSSMIYFTGVRWGRSERPTLAVLPVEGDALIVTPFFEEPSVRETLAVPATVRTWQEDGDALAVVAGWLRERGLRGPIGIEETVRSFIPTALARAAPDLQQRPANPVVRGCRMVKTAPEIALMQLATEVTLAAYRWTHSRIEKGMAGPEISALMNAATTKLGGSPEFTLALIGPAAALPHGSREVHRVGEGQVLLMDCGCTVQGYQSDVSRTWVPIGTASREVRTVWDQVAKGQQVAFAAAKLGAPAGSVDGAVRRYYTGLGYGPDYALPGLSHRTGHGIGLDGHEPVNLVRGEATPLAPGMCFSDEPGLYLPGKFGVRLEDCFHLTAAGPKWFSTPPTSIDRPI
ncbi:M24 family metallopeptidase [Sphingomonas aerophila]|uniref:Xaa-Pro dipeptidase n=1 Tax=Sphingomonas aerophila TaxID=1344948 RepID=A0A7W9EU24_9SPHN|nr:Xaa-Pro peptidase family protein [Sphingomonas aerophila]MBB5714710.1 Xaa-Pro dipeptidase [Sphingomonas aerophila]